MFVSCTLNSLDRANQTNKFQGNLILKDPRTDLSIGAWVFSWSDEMTNYAKNETEEVAEIARETFSYNALTGVVTRLKASKSNARYLGSTGVLVKDVWG